MLCLQMKSSAKESSSLQRSESSVNPSLLNCFNAFLESELSIV